MTDFESDDQLLQRFVRTRDEAAFRVLVERHFNLVYSIACRETRNADLAKDVAQQVFISFARNADRPTGSAHLAPWLHRITRNMARKLNRTEIRRQRREAAALAGASLEDSPAWERISPEIDSLIARLPALDRQVVILRFYMGHSHADVASQLHLTAQAARKRCDRSLEKLRMLLGRRGIATTGSALASLLPAHAVGAAPAGLAGATATAALATLPAAAPTLTFLGLILMKTTTKIAIVTASAAVILGTTWFISGRSGSSPASIRSTSSENGISGSPDANRSMEKPGTPARSSRSKGAARGREMDSPQLAELKALFQDAPGVGPSVESDSFDDYLSNLDAKSAREAVEYLMSSDGKYLFLLEPIVEQWATLDPEQAIAWSNKKGGSGYVKSVLDIWAKKDPDAAIAWVEATPSTVDGKSDYITILESIHESPDYLSKANSILEKTPLSDTGSKIFDSVSGNVRQKGFESTTQWVESLPEQWKKSGTSAVEMYFGSREPERVLNWMSETGRLDDDFPMALQGAFVTGKEQEVSRFIDSLVSEEQKARFRMMYGELEETYRKLRSEVTDGQ